MAGTVDGAAAAVEAGTVAAGNAAEMTGTSTVLLMAGSRDIFEPAFISMPHALPGLHLLLGAISSSGASLRWFRDQIGSGSPSDLNSYEELTRQAAGAPPGSGGVLFLPYMAGERSPLWDTDARGVFFGLSLATERAALVRALLEGTAFALRHNVEVARAAGLPVDSLRSVGGGAKSPLWCQIKADVLGIPVRVPVASCGAPFGGAVLAGMGLGLYPDPAAAVTRMVREGACFDPDPVRHRLYGEMYGVFREVYERLKGTFARAAGIGAAGIGAAEMAASRGGA
jgi:xylulokinase